MALDGAAVATAVVYNSPAFTALLAWRFFGERLSTAKIVAILLSMARCILAPGAYDTAALEVNVLGSRPGCWRGERS